MQRYRLQSELQTKVEELQLTLDGALSAQLEHELVRATQRAAEVVRPFEAFVEATHASQCEREAKLAASREQLDEFLYAHWGQANRSDVNFLDPSSPFWWVAAFQEGTYQGALHFERFDTGSLHLNYTVLYNGSFWPSAVPRARI